MTRARGTCHRTTLAPDIHVKIHEQPSLKQPSPIQARSKTPDINQIKPPIPQPCSHTAAIGRRPRIPSSTDSRLKEHKTQSTQTLSQRSKAPPDQTSLPAKADKARKPCRKTQEIFASAARSHDISRSSHYVNSTRQTFRSVDECRDAPHMGWHARTLC